MNRIRLEKLRDYIKGGGEIHTINFKEVFGESKIVLGVDEFPAERKAIKAFFRLTDKDFDFLFVPGNIRINTTGEYVALISSFLHLKK